MFKNVVILIVLLACVVTVVPLVILVADAVIGGLENSVLGKLIDKIE